MATVALSRFRELLARATGTYVAGIVDSGSTTTVVDATTLTEVSQYATNRLVNTWLHILTADSAAPEGESRRVASVAGDTQTVGVAYTVAPAIGDTYENLPHHPNDMNDAIKEAIRKSYPRLYLPLMDESLKVDNLLSNWDFETFTVANVPDNWTVVASPTVTEETTRVFQGTSALKVVSTAAGDGHYQDIFTGVNIQDVAGKSIKFNVRCWSDGATDAIARVSFDGGSTFTDSSSHSGSSEWEKLEVNATVPVTATSIRCYLWLTTITNTVYWDDAHCSVGVITKYTTPATFVAVPARLSQQATLSDPNGNYVPVTTLNPASTGRILRLEGMGQFTVPTADTDTILVTETQAEYIVAMAAFEMYRRLMNTDVVNRDEHRENRDYWQTEVARLYRQPGVVMRAIPAQFSHGAVGFSKDASGNYFSLARA